ncbi:MAG: hypothetical protein ACHQCH_03640 [Solirubrobacterales bacterium]
MSRSSGFASHRFLLALIALLLLGLSGASAAPAETLPAECGTLQAQLTAASTRPGGGEGDTVVLKGMCESLSLGGSGVTIPKGSNFTLEGAPSTTSGIDAAGFVGSALSGTELASFTITKLTFEHSNTVAVSLRGERLTLSSDSFLENSNNDTTSSALFIGGGEPTCAPGNGPAISLLDSTFRANTLTVGGGVGAGGAAFLLDSCTNGAPNLVEGNVFEGNTLRANGSEQALGAGLLFAASATDPPPLMQLGNVFAANSILDIAGKGRYGGGGEWTEGVSLTSVDDRFSTNTIPGTEGAYWSYGAGLGIVACNSTTPTENALENAVVAGNSIDGGSPADAGGAGIYSGCGKYLTTPDHLRLLNSTVTENAVPNGGIAGIYGKPSDQLEVANSIVAADSGGAEIGGFNGTGGSLGVSFSDVCSGSSPFAGAGNICAPPLLASASDVHETSASPTIDAGSNALVPSGLSTDAFGTTRILAGHAACGVSFPAVVDIGAEEFQSASPSCPAPVTPRPPVPGLTHYISRKVSPTGIAVKLSCSSTDGLGCSGTIFLTTNEILQGKRVIAVGASHHTRGSVRLGQAPFSLAAGSTATFTVKLNSTGLELLRRFHAISAFMLANEVSPTSTPFIFLLDGVRFSQPKHKSKKHKSRHAKRRH